MPFRPRLGLAALGQLPHGHLGLLVRDVDVNFERLLVDMADPATEREEIHPGEDGDRAEGMPECVVRALEAELAEAGPSRARPHASRRWACTTTAVAMTGFTSQQAKCFWY